MAARGKCPWCEGRGMVPKDGRTGRWERCSVCRGSGRNARSNAKREPSIEVTGSGSWWCLRCGQAFEEVPTDHACSGTWRIA